MGGIFLIALFVRLIFLYVFRDINNFDISSYLKIGNLISKGINIYPIPAEINHPYFPFYLWLEAAATYISRINIGQIGLIRHIGPISPIIYLKFTSIIFDLGNVLLVYLLSNKSKDKALIYALNPVSILVFVLHGQFDAIPLFFLLLSIYFIKSKKITLSLLTFSFSILTKTWPMLFLITFIKRIKYKKYILLTLVFPLIFTILYSFIFKVNPLNILKTVFKYQGIFGIWGWTKLIFFIKTGAFIQRSLSIMFLSLFYLYSITDSKKNLLEEIYVLIIFFFVFTTGFSIQYFSWFMPFLIIKKPKYWLFLILLITFDLLTYYSYYLVFPNGSATPKYLSVLQTLTDIFLWINFIKVWHISKNYH